MKDRNETEIEALLKIMARLRDPDNGCPWDLEQDFQSILPHTLEEAYEVADAIQQTDMVGLKEELGDLLFQIVFYAQLAKEKGLFDFDDICQTIRVKMIERHPHVFGSAEIDSAHAQSEAWEEGKAKKRHELARQGGNKPSQLDNIALALPALLRAEKLQKRAARIGFDWTDRATVLEKIQEELQELKEAEIPSHQEEEIGDVLFAIANLARHYGVNPEEALRKANQKFERRFRRVEDLVGSKEIGGKFNLETLDAAWNKAKAEERE